MMQNVIDKILIAQYIDFWRAAHFGSFFCISRAFDGQSMVEMAAFYCEAHQGCMSQGNRGGVLSKATAIRPSSDNPVLPSTAIIVHLGHNWECPLGLVSYLCWPRESQTCHKACLWHWREGKDRTGNSTGLPIRTQTPKEMWVALACAILSVGEPCNPQEVRNILLPSPSESVLWSVEAAHICVKVIIN